MLLLLETNTQSPFRVEVASRTGNSFEIIGAAGWLETYRRMFADNTVNWALFDRKIVRGFGFGYASTIVSVRCIGEVFKMWVNISEPTTIVDSELRSA